MAYTQWHIEHVASGDICPEHHMKGGAEHGHIAYILPMVHLCTTANSTFFASISGGGEGWLPTPFPLLSHVDRGIISVLAMGTIFPRYATSATALLDH